MKLCRRVANKVKLKRVIWSGLILKLFIFSIMVDLVEFSLV